MAQLPIDSEQWRSRAEEVRRFAEQQSSSDFKRWMLRVASDYERFAKYAERRAEVRRRDGREATIL